MQSVSISSRQSDNRRIQEEKRYTRCSQSGILFFPPNYCGSILRFNRNNTGADRNWQAQKKKHSTSILFLLFSFHTRVIDKSCTSYGSVPCQDVTEALPQSNLTCRHTKVQSESLKIIHFKRALTRAILLQLSESYILRNRNKFNRSDKRKKKYSLLATHDKDRAIATLVFVRSSSFIPSPKYGRQGNKSDATCTQSSSFSSIQSPFF